MKCLCTKKCLNLIRNLVELMIRNEEYRENTFRRIGDLFLNNYGDRLKNNSKNKVASCQAERIVL